MLIAAFAKRVGEFQLELALEVPAGKTLVLLGESGAGKSMTLRLLAGLMDPDTGKIQLGDEVYFDGAAKRSVPASRRRVGYVPQDYALFPHLSVFENVAFGLKAQGMAGDAAQAMARGALDRFGVGELSRRLPRELSGGQQQRVALARALVTEPDLLLLDEPLSSLDAHTRQSVRSELRSLLESLSCVTVLVTHDPEDAQVFGSRVVTLAAGRSVGLAGD